MRRCGEVKTRRQESVKRSPPRYRLGIPFAGDSPAALVFRLEAERHPIHAKALARGPRAIRENVAQVGIALRAADFRSAHQKRPVLVLGHGVIVHRLIEARPSGAGLEFGVGREKGRATAHAGENTLALLVVERACARALCAMLARDLVLLWRQLRPPLSIAFLDSLRHLPKPHRNLIA